MTRLVLVRHGEPAAEARGRCYGSLDVGLSEAGLEQARATAGALAEVPLAAVYTSPRVRAARTAAEIAAPHGLDPLVEDDLRELDFGELEGRTYDEIAASDPALYRRWMEAPTTVRFPGGESYADLRTRALAAAEALRRRHPDGTIAAVTHGGVVRALLAEALAMPAEAIFRLELGYGRLSAIEWLDGVPVVRVVNATGL